MQAQGTFLNGQQLVVHKPTKLLTGHTVRFGTTSFIFTVSISDETSMSASGSAPYSLLRRSHHAWPMCEVLQTAIRSPHAFSRILALFPTHQRTTRVPYLAVLSFAWSNVARSLRKCASAKHACCAGMQASHLLVKHAKSRNPKSWKEDPVTRSPEEALRMIESFREQLMVGDPATLPRRFADLARTESHCSSAKRGGDLGPFRCGVIVAPGNTLAPPKIYALDPFLGCASTRLTGRFAPKLWDLCLKLSWCYGIHTCDGVFVKASGHCLRHGRSHPTADVEDLK
jgi:hypothetical protein